MPRQISGIKQSSIIPNSPIDEQKQRPIDFPQQAPFVNRRTTSQRTNSSGEKNDAFGRQHRRTPSAGQDSALKRLYASSPPTSPDSSRRKLVSLSDDSDASDQEKKEHEPSLAPSTNSSGSRSVKAKSENINALIHINLGNKNMADGEQELQDGEAAAGGVVEGRDGSIPIKGTSQNNCRSLGPSFNSLNNSFNRSNVSMGLAYMTPPASSSKNITEDALLGLPPIEIKSSSDTNLFVQHHQQQGQLLQVPSLASSSKTSSSCSFGGSAAPVPAAAARMCEDIIETSNLEYPSDNEKDNDEDLEPFVKSV